MSTTLASVNPTSTHILGKIPSILRDDNAKFYTPGFSTSTNALAAIADDAAAEKIVDDTTSTFPETCILLMTCHDSDWLGAGIFLLNAGVITELFDSGTKVTGGTTDTDGGLCLYITSNDLYFRNRTGSALDAGSVRIYRLA